VQHLRRRTHKTIQRVTENIEQFHYNTMLAALMEYANYLVKTQETVVVGTPAWQEAIESLLLLLAPTAPHLTEELWSQLGKPYSIHEHRWPQWEPDLASDEVVTYVIQVNGRVRDRITVTSSTSEEKIREVALTRERVRRFVGNNVKKIIYVPGRLINIVTAT
jgi:leucyl-tRNA synthetase